MAKSESESEKKAKKKYYRKTAIYPPRRWTQREIDLILAHEYTDYELSSMVKHSVEAIQVKRCKLKERE